MSLIKIQNLKEQIDSIYKAMRYRDLPKHIKWSVIDRWATNPFLVKTFADNIRKELNEFPENKRNDVIILFSAHSIPLKVNYCCDFIASNFAFI